MRVIAGRLGGRQLLAPKGWQVRPTPERVREAMFSALGDIAGARVADLYCGTGALGIEALSRGASHAVLVDRDTKPALGNVHNLGLEGESELVRGDPVRWAADNDGRRTFDLVFLDPPYRQTAEVAAQLDAHAGGLLAPGGRLAVESEVGREVSLPSLEVVRERRYGRTLITFLVNPSSPEGQ
jgi:16S rRNA (guanine(966)-N(2))-methyltransferase RsmD